MKQEKIDPAQTLESLYLIYTHNLHQIRLKMGKLSELKQTINDLENFLEGKKYE
ncbi:MAG: hypothetical protein HYV59_08975 [Planctomycetes bacterium]|nr:hypothetical protein [Planctomycetota bacterium]